MKALKNIFYVLLGTVAVVSVASCSDSPDYEQAPTPTNEQVYFPNTNPQEFRLSGSETSFDIAVKRANTNGALTVALDVEGDSLFTLPHSVSFADGQEEAVLKVGYSLATLGYDNPQDVTVALRDSVQGTPYGISTYKFNAIIPSPWTSLGRATITDDIISHWWAVNNIQFTAEIQENDLTPGFYRLVNAYTSEFPYNDPPDYDGTQNYYIYLHAEDPDKVWFEDTKLGLNWGYGDIYAWSRADWALSRGNDPTPWYGTLKNGEITFPAGGILVHMTEYNDNGLYAANDDGMFSVLLPGYVKADYSAAVVYAGIFTDKEENIYAVADVELGGDAKDVKAVVMPQDADAAAVADAIASGELEATDVQAGRIQVPFNAEELGGSKFQVIVVVIADGEAKNLATTNFEYYSGSANPWESIGTGYYTDDAVITLFTHGGVPYEPITYEVEFMYNAQEGIYRIMNPYSNSVYPYADDDCAEEGLFLEVNAADPEGVYIPRQSLGFDWGRGEFVLESAGYYYMANKGQSFDDVKAANRFATLKDGVIEFPVLSYTYTDDDGAEQTAYWQGNIYMGSSMYDAGTNGGMRIVLPGAASEVKSKAAAKARATRFEARLKSLSSSKSNILGKDKVMIKTLCKNTNDQRVN